MVEFEYTTEELPDAEYDKITSVTLADTNTTRVETINIDSALRTNDGIVWNVKCLYTTDGLEITVETISERKQDVPYKYRKFDSVDEFEAWCDNTQATVISYNESQNI